MTLTWAADLGLVLQWGFDDLSLVMVGLVGVVGAAVGAWIATEQDHDAARLVGLLGTFLVAMVGLLTALDGLSLFIAWEVTSILSYVLVGFDRTDKALRAARTTLVVTGLGGIALLVAVLLMSSATGSFELANWHDADPTDPSVVAAAWLLLAAAVTKSAQVPLHGWLVGAKTAPTAASAFLHAATLVVAGVYLVTRLSPMLAGVAGWTATTTTIGLLTFIVGHVIAVRRESAKSLLAATTAAQLGLAMAVAAGGTTESIGIAVGLLLVHGAYKAGMFLIAGSVKNSTHDASVRAVWPATRARPALRTALVLGILAMASAPPLAGWATKEAAVDHLLHQSWLAAAGLAVGAALGVVASARLVGSGLRPGTETPTPMPAVPERPRARLAAAPILALLVPVAVFGMWTTPLQSVSNAAASAVTDGDKAKIVLWPGFKVALAVSVGSLLVGVLLTWWARAREAPTEVEPGPEVTILGSLIDGALDRCGGWADWVDGLDRTAVVGIVTATAFGSLVLLGLSGPVDMALDGTWPPLARSSGQVFAAAILIAGVVGVTTVRDRVPAAIMLGIVGFSVAALFAFHGAPDLVLTQIVVEAVIIVVFVGVLLRLHPRSRAQSIADGRGAIRTATALIAGLGAGLVAIVGSIEAGPRPLRRDVIEAAEPVGAGKNVVNVILTDFRALDTIGELAVLFLAAIAVLALVQVAARTSPAVVTAPASELLERAMPVLTRLAIVLAIHLLVVGHDQPGGGFIGGLVFGAGIALHRLGTGRLPPLPVLRHPVGILATGMAIVGAVAVLPLATGRAVADMGATTLELGLLGQPKLTSALALDIGVLLVVVGLVVVTLETLGTGHASLINPTDPVAEPDQAPDRPVRDTSGDADGPPPHDTDDLAPVGPRGTT